MLGAVVAEELYRRFPDADEGWLSRARATVVRASTLAEVAEEIGLGAEIRLGKGEEATGGREKPSILADGLEALIGAVHIDAGRAASAAGGHDPPGRPHRRRRRVPRATSTTRRSSRSTPARSWARWSATGWSTPAPSTTRPSWPPPASAARSLGSGTGRTKKQAEQRAARQAYEALTGPEADDAADPDHHPDDASVSTGPPITPAGPAPAPSSKDEDA